MKEKYLALIRDKRFLGALLAVTFAYVTFFTFLRNPLLEENTASLLGLRYPGLFFLWQMLVGLALMCGTLAVYHAYGCPKPLRTIGKAFAWIGPPCQAIIYFVHGEIVEEEFVYPGITYPVHFTASIVLIVAILFSVGIAFFLARRRARRFNALLGAIGAVAAAMLAIFFTIGKSGLFESAPLLAVLLMLFLVHCTPWFRLPEEAAGKKTEGKQ
ncbi:MAG: hypothetical protein LBB75_02880 [Oscillospiraceae bacterium]|nr:hypothetical protein [Oscillospiraceae bacterium]